MSVDLRGELTKSFSDQASNPYAVQNTLSLNNNFQTATANPNEIAQVNDLTIQPVVAPTNNNDLLHNVENTGYSIANTADGFQPSGGLGELLGAAENLVSDVRASIQEPQQPQLAVGSAPSLDQIPASMPVINYAHKSTMSFSA